ncbi:hypothetical protein KQI82_01875 [Oscillibacter sp. MSJ-2]|uniref:Restriction alleviation protein, Lar family n=1 Tax=Dysosmobacter acutus TaxID=2841504 RepID=A0ABS6F5V9_9FIRM|nr:hypothetical protein [Dysosmobacter acutus]MBU5625683.1 hypothetical protein [Dysosmobacter acutus]
MSRLVHNPGDKDMLSSIDLADTYVNSLELRRCPFCGEEAEVYAGSMCGRIRVVVLCSKCKCSTPSEFTGHELIGGKDIMVYDAISAAAARWNRRQ